MLAAVLPHTIYTIFPFSYNIIILSTVIISTFFIATLIRWRFQHEVLIFSVGSVMLGVLAWVIIKELDKGATLIAPIVTLFAYTFFRQKSFSLGLVILVWTLLIVYFWVIYYSKLPSFFNRGIYFDEDAIVFERASSNGIAIALNFTCLFAVLVSDKNGDNKWYGFMVFYAILNVILITSQGSRSGIVASILVLLYLARIKLKYVLITLVLMLSYGWTKISFIDFQGTKEVRYMAQSEFLSSLFDSFSIVGPQKETYAGLKYTFNPILDSIERYTVFYSLILIALILKAIYSSISSEKFYLISFILIYLLTEGILFPEYWDFMVLSLLLKNYRHDNFFHRRLPSVE